MLDELADFLRSSDKPEDSKRQHREFQRAPIDKSSAVEEF